MGNLLRNRKIYEPPRFMSVSQALFQLSEIEKHRGQGHCAPETIVVGIARLGREDQKMVAGPSIAVANTDLGGPLHSLVICAPELHEMERTFLDLLQPPQM